MRRGHERTIELHDHAVPGVCETMLEQIVHDLKNPLNTIALEVGLLGDKLAVGDTEGRAALARVSRNVFFLDRMVRDLLDTCSLESGHFEIRRKPTELRALIARVVDRVVSTRDSGRVWIQASLPLTLAIDELRIERVIANLLQNALKYTPRASLIGIRLDVSEDRARISVIDAGPGLAVGDAARVFDKYHRNQSSATHDGSGLGLYVSKQIVEAHGGKIGVDSVDGAGSRFYFELPRM
jgi:K+-sensing histidine kinase KdpD